MSNEGRSSALLVPGRLFLGPGFRLGARWTRLGEAVKTRKTREFPGKKWARYGLKRVNKGRERRDHLVLCHGELYAMVRACQLILG